MQLQLFYKATKAIFLSSILIALSDNFTKGGNKTVIWYKIL